jgi:hypothetical protein
MSFVLVSILCFCGLLVRCLDVDRSVRVAHLSPLSIVCSSLVGSYALDEELQEKLWTFSEQLMREKVKEP